MEINKQYNQVGDDYISARKNQGSIKEQRSKEFVFKNLNLKDKIVLDLGCGHGEDIIAFEKARVKEVYGIDSSEIMVSEAKKKAKTPEKLLVADISKLPFPNNQFDIIVAKHSLHYISDLNLAWKEISRVLKKGGELIFTVPHPFSEIFLKNGKDYSVKEEIFFNAHKKFILEFPSHTLSEYLTKDFLGIFEIAEIWEFSKEEDWIKDIISPVVLGIKAIKK